MFSNVANPSERLMLARHEDPPGPSAMKAAMAGMGGAVCEKLSPFNFRRWEILKGPTPNVGENDTSLSLMLFEAIKHP